MYIAPPSLSKERCFSWYPQEWALPVLTWFSLLHMLTTLPNLLNLLSLWSLRTTGGIPQCEYLRFGDRQPALEWDEPNPIWMKLVETCMRFFSGYLGTFPYCKSSQRCGDGVLLSPNMCSVRISQVDLRSPTTIRLAAWISDEVVARCCKFIEQCGWNFELCPSNTDWFSWKHVFHPGSTPRRFQMCSVQMYAVGLRWHMAHIGCWLVALWHMACVGTCSGRWLGQLGLWRKSNWFASAASARACGPWDSSRLWVSCSRPWRTGVTKVRLKLDQTFTISRKSFEGKVQPILRFLGVLVVTSVRPYWIIPVIHCMWLLSSLMDFQNLHVGKSSAWLCRRMQTGTSFVTLSGSDNVRRALSESPAPLSTRESAMESVRRRWQGQFSPGISQIPPWQVLS